MFGRLMLVMVVAGLLVGCQSVQTIDRATLVERYEQTQLAEGVLSVVPLRLEADAQPPVVVNWWYAGTSENQHRIIYRELTWDSAGKPVGKEVRYRVAKNQLVIVLPFAVTSDAARWLPLYEAAENEVEPPADLPTARKAPSPEQNEPIRLPDASVQPPSE